MKVGFLDAWRDNTLLRGIDAGEFELDTEIPAGFIPGFVEEADLEPGPERDFLEEFGFRFDAYVGFHPPHCAFLGADFWQVGRYIVVRTSEIDSAYHFVPEGIKINVFVSKEEAKEAFEQISSIALLVNRMTQYDES